jgi:hypothetical protein
MHRCFCPFSQVRITSLDPSQYLNLQGHKVQVHTSAVVVLASGTWHSDTLEQCSTWKYGTESQVGSPHMSGRHHCLGISGHLKLSQFGRGKIQFATYGQFHHIPWRYGNYVQPYLLQVAAPHNSAGDNIEVRKGSIAT